MRLLTSRRVAALAVVAVSVTLLVTVDSATAASPHGSAAQTVCHRAAGASPLQKLCQSVRLGAPGTRTMTAAAEPAPYTATELRSAYKVPPSTTHATVAVVDAFRYGGRGISHDLNVYRSRNHLGYCGTQSGCLRVVNQRGGSTPPAHSNAGWAGETALDVEMVSAICPSCHILLVQADDDDRSGNGNLEAAVHRAVAMGARYVSMSWGASEFRGETQTDGIFAKRGVAYVAAAGDGGYGTMWPAASRWVTAVGGTRLVRHTATKPWSESVWSGTGSGCSRFESEPGWQHAAVPAGSCVRRAETDVAMDAAVHPGVAVYTRGHVWRYGGTSAATPMVAALYAIAGTPHAGSTPAFYPYANGAAALQDVTAGTNRSGCGSRLCRAGTGWDGPSGLGSPLGIGVAAFRAPPAGGVSIHNPGHVTGFAGGYKSVNVAGSDSRNRRLTYTARGLPRGVSLHGNGTLTGRPVAHTKAAVAVTAWDPGGGSATARFTWTVRQHRLVPSTRPHVVGKFRVGHAVHVTPGRFHVDSAHGAKVSAHLAVRWYLNGHRIKGATHAKLHLRPAYRHGRVSARVKAHRTYFYGWSAKLHAHRVR